MNNTNVAQLLGYTSVNCTVMSNSLSPHGQYPARLLSPWTSPGKNTGVGCHFLGYTVGCQNEVNLLWGELLDRGLPGLDLS